MTDTASRSKAVIEAMKGARTRLRASSQAFLRSVTFALLTLMVSRSPADTGMLRGPGGFSGEVKLLRRELETGADGSGESPDVADFLVDITVGTVEGEETRVTRETQATCSIRGGKVFLFLAVYAESVSIACQGKE